MLISYEAVPEIKLSFFLKGGHLPRSGSRSSLSNG